MKIKSALLATITLSSLPSLASADVYLDGNYAFIDEDDFEVGALVFKGGITLNEWAALEAAPVSA